jgi:hypothetical protein
MIKIASDDRADVSDKPDAVRLHQLLDLLSEEILVKKHVRIAVEVAEVKVDRDNAAKHVQRHEHSPRAGAAIFVLALVRPLKPQLDLVAIKVEEVPNPDLHDLWRRNVSLADFLSNVSDFSPLSVCVFGNQHLMKRGLLRGCFL